MSRIIDHTHPNYRNLLGIDEKRRYNGAYYYSREIVKNIIPRVETDRNWITINVRGVGCNHAIVFVHNNLHPENYDWLNRYDDLILVCGIPGTMDKVSHLGRAVYLPLSIDVEYVRQFRSKEKTKTVAYAGRKSKMEHGAIPEGVDVLSGMPRPRLLRTMAEYEEVYAVGRTAIEARCLGCKVKAYDPRFPDVDVWRVVDNSDAAKMLQEIIDE